MAEQTTPLTPGMRAFLAEPRFAVLATVNPDGSPHQTVMWFELDGDLILFNTRRGRVKTRNLARDDRVSLCVEDAYRFVSIAGRIASLDDDQERAKADILRLGIRYDGLEEAARQMREVWAPQTRVTYRMTIERVTADGF